MTRPLTDTLFRPRGIVVYGASADPAKLSGRPIDYLKKFGFEGNLYAINPKHEVVQGMPAFTSVKDVPDDADLAVIVVPAHSVAEAVRSCGEAGVGAAIVFASGFSEIGADGEADQEALAAIARETGIRILGPNCLGLFASPTKAFATFSTAFDDVAGAPDSPIAIASQSGAVGTFTYSTMNDLGLGTRYYANPGNSVDVTVIELLHAIAELDDVDILMGHLEDGQDLVAFDELCRAAADRSKPLLILKGGRSDSGARAIARHTGSTAGDSTQLETAAARYGTVLVRSMEEWADAALAFSTGRKITGPRLTLVTQSGGAGAIAVDHATDLGLRVDPWSDSAAEQSLLEGLPFFASVENPVDLTGAMINDVNLLRRSLRIISENGETDAILAVHGNTDSGADAIVDALIEAHEATEKPLFVAWTGGSGRPRRRLLDAGVPCYTDPNRAVQAIHAMAVSAQVL